MAESNEMHIPNECSGCELAEDVRRVLEAAAAVVDAFAEEKRSESIRGNFYWLSKELTGTVENLRIAAGIKAPPIDEPDGDRADEAYERAGDR